MSQDEPLQKVRGQIDDIDDQINSLLAKRAACAQEIKRLKHGKTIYRPKREAEILSRMVAEHSGDLPKESLRAIYTEIIAACRNLEQTLTVAYLGPPGSYSFAIAQKLFGSSSEFLSQQTLKEVIVAVEQGKADVGVVPIENSTEGPVVEVQKLLHQTDLQVLSEAVLPITHTLLSNIPLEEVKTVYAHPQSYGQCRMWMQTNLPRAHVVSATSNSEAARMAAEHKHAAAIASREAGELYGIAVVSEAINDESGNETRFLTLGKQPAEPTGRDKTTIIVTLKDKYGSLYSLLGEFVKFKIDLTNLKSQPVGGGLHTFFIEFLGHKDDPNVAQALKDIQAHSTQCKIIGSYPREAV